MESWNDKYIKKNEPLVKAKTGQGTTYLCAPKDNPKDFRFVLKILNDQKTYKSRKRIREEVQILEQLDHPGIVRLVDDNVDSIDKMNTNLFLVTEYIPGQPLDDFVRTRTLNLEEAIELMILLLDAIDYCHDHQIIHRDIKPKNIVIAANGKPVLIDFGISFNFGARSIESRGITGAGEQVGNRFLELPELRDRSGDPTEKRDKRSDVCLCVGILFFLLTGVEPSRLFDQKQRYPHQRSRERERLQKVAGEKIIPLLRMFDTGFQQDPDRRFQSVVDLETELISILKYEQPTNVSTNVSEALSLFEKSGQVKELTAQSEILSCVHLRVVNSAGRIGHKFPQQLQWSQANGWQNAHEMGVQIGFKSIAVASVGFIAAVKAYFVGAEVVVDAEIDDERIEIFRTSKLGYLAAMEQFDKDCEAFFEKRLVLAFNSASL